MAIIGHKGIQVLSNINSPDDLPDYAEVENEAVWYIESGDFAPDYIAPSFWDGQQFNQWISLVDGEVLHLAIPDSGLLYDYDAQSEERSAGSISTIKDQFGSNDATGDLSFVDTGINGLPSYEFNGVDQDAEANDPATLGSGDEYTAAIVVEPFALNDTYAFESAGSDGYSFRFEDTPTYNWTHSGVENNRGGNPTANTAIIVIGAYDGSTLYVDVDGANIINTSVSLATPSGGLSIGSRDGTENLEGYVGQLRFYDEFYDSSGRTEIHDGLASRWGF